MVADLSFVAGPLSPERDRCSDCGRPVGRRKGRPLVRCGLCSLLSLRARHRAYDAAHRVERQARRRQGRPCPPYVAWTVWALGAEQRAWAVAVDPQEPDAVVLPAYGACSCGEAGCVHLVVTCLA